jgi:hypothetical protein
VMAAEVEGSETVEEAVPGSVHLEAVQAGCEKVGLQGGSRCGW